MRTTLDINDALLAQAKAHAAKSRQSLKALVEEALRLRLTRHAPARTARSLPLPVSGSGGLRPGVDLTDNAALLDLTDEDS